eukprot:Gregarina_sp_Pseudo_9__2071@NODE_2438_length_995_cov_277_186192_g2244_i0_p1_GENE_NODE_2438_length_995_cov_277_186192_g2244_i0NODE_2438_length_995_cov_277_186192_g2244_i0_p1_ORF_typecomplete_len199_score18_44Prion_bPrPp/PF11587_8/0_47_NODE_2438_length_995_cov_277_186192_g2244_i0297893
MKCWLALLFLAAASAVDASPIDVQDIDTQDYFSFTSTQPDLQAPAKTGIQECIRLGRNYRLDGPSFSVLNDLVQEFPVVIQFTEVNDNILTFRAFLGVDFSIREGTWELAVEHSDTCSGIIRSTTMTREMDGGCCTRAKEVWADLVFNDIRMFYFSDGKLTFGMSNTQEGTPSWARYNGMVEWDHWDHLEDGADQDAY